MTKRNRGVTTIRAAIPTTNRTAVRAADIRMVAVFFCDLPVCSNDHYGMCGDPTPRQGDDWDSSAHRCVGHTMGPSAISTIDTVKNCVVRALWNCGVGVPRHHQTATGVKQPLQTHQRGGGESFRKRSSSIRAPTPPKSNKGGGFEDEKSVFSSKEEARWRRRGTFF